jgi:hypothetical protein
MAQVRLTFSGGGRRHRRLAGAAAIAGRGWLNLPRPDREVPARSTFGCEGIVMKIVFATACVAPACSPGSIEIAPKQPANMGFSLENPANASHTLHRETR